MAETAAPRTSGRRAAAPSVTLYDRSSGLGLVARYTLLGVVAFIVLFPVYTTVLTAFKPAKNMFVDRLLPTSFSVQPFVDAWTEGRLGRYLVTSGIVAVAVTAAQVATSLMSAYAFAMLDFPLRRTLFVVLLATLLVPMEATLVVNRRTIDSLGWINSYQALIIPFTATAFGTFLVRQALLALPTDLRDAARIDGVGHLGFIRHVAVPLVRPTLGALALFAFLGNWNSYLWPSLVTTRADMNTVQSGLKTLRGQSVDAPNVVMAGTIIAAIPILIVLMIFQRQLIRGLTAGAVKG